MTNTPMVFLIVLFIFLVSLSSCSKGEEASAGKQSQHKDEQSGKLRVKILPEVSSAADDLQAVFSGGGSVTYRWEKNGQVLEGEQSQRLAKKCFSRGDVIGVVVTSNGEQGRASLTIGNAPSQVTSVSVTPANIRRGVNITAIPAGFDADGDPIRYSFKWVINGQEMPEDSQVLKGDVFKCGDKVSVKVTPYDGYEAGREYATQAFVVPNAPPYFVSDPPVTFNNNVYVYDVKAEDPDGDAISYTLVSAPAGMTINSSTGRIEWQMARQSRDYSMEIEARDSKGSTARQKYSLTVSAP